MSNELPFTPRLGRIKDGGSAGQNRFSNQIAKRVARLNKNSGPKGYVRASQVRGAKASAAYNFRNSPYPALRMRRTIVKVHIARAGFSGGAKSFGEHVSYIERDGVDRDGNQGQSYDKDNNQIDTRDFKERSASDKRQFRFIVSAEDAMQIPDLKPEIRDFMSGMEKDLGTKLDWMAVDHFDTAQPHTHIIVRGVDELGDPLAIDRNYLMEGMRARLSNQLTISLGPRRDVEILRSQTRDVSADRITPLDTTLEKQISTINAPRHESDRFKHSLMLKRLSHLQKLGLAEQQQNQWALKGEWKDTLRQMGRRGDLVRSINTKYKNLDLSNRFEIFNPVKPPSHDLIGKVLGTISTNELKETRALLIEGLDGKTWSVDIGSRDPVTLPAKGSTVSIYQSASKLQKSDYTIAKIAALNNNLWSEDIHLASEPESSSQYRRAHKRRLEALRRRQIVSRNTDGSWNISKDYLAKVQAYEQTNPHAIQIEAKSHQRVKNLVKVNALTWLDEIEPTQCADIGYGALAKQAISERHAWLKQQGIIQTNQSKLSTEAKQALKAIELTTLANMETSNTTRNFSPFNQTTSFDGKFERVINAHQGQVALIGRADTFTLVPLKSGLQNSLGRNISLTRKGSTIDWTIGRQKGISR